MTDGAVQGWASIEALLADVRSKTDDTVTVEDEDNDNVWDLIQQDSKLSFSTKVIQGRKLLKTTILTDADIATAMECFLPNEETPEWDETYTSVREVKDYFGDGRAYSDKRITMDKVIAVNVRLPWLLRMFIKVPKDLEMRVVVSKESDGSCHFLCVSWDSIANTRNMKFKIRKYGKFEAIGDQTKLTAIEKTGRWIPGWVVVKFAESGQLKTVVRKVKEYKKFRAERQK